MWPTSLAIALSSVTMPAKVPVPHRALRVEPPTCCEKGPVETPLAAEIAASAAALAANALVGQPFFAAAFVPLAVLARFVEASTASALVAASLVYAPAAVLLERPDGVFSGLVVNLAIATLLLRLPAEGRVDRLIAGNGEGETQSDLERFDQRLRAAIRKREETDRSR